MIVIKPPLLLEKGLLHNYPIDHLYIIIIISVHVSGRQFNIRCKLPIITSLNIKYFNLFI